MLVPDHPPLENKRKKNVRKKNVKHEKFVEFMTFYAIIIKY